MNKTIQPFKSRLLPILLILIVFACAYGPSLGNGFVWDDYLHIVDNRFIKSFDNLPLVFSRKYLTSPADLPYLTQKNVGAGELSYRPVVTLTYFGEFAFWGLKAFGYHLTNVLLHFLNTLFVYNLSLTIYSRRRFALIAALIFAVHPAQAEAVLTVAFREDLLACFFMLSSFFLYLRSQRKETRQKGLWYFSCCLCYALALFAKEMALTLPFLIMCYEYSFVRNGGGRFGAGTMIRRYAGLGATAAVYFWVWLFVIPRLASAAATYPGGSFYINILTMLKVFAIYGMWLVMPVNIHPTMPEESFCVKGFWDPAVLPSLAAIAACWWLAYACRRKSPLVTFAVMWFFIALLPVANIIPLENIMAARYLYVPIIGFCLITAAFLEKLWGEEGKFVPLLSASALRAFFIGILLFYILQTLAQSFDWTNEISFRRAFLRHYPQNVRAYRTLAGAYFRFNRYEEAIFYIQKAKVLAPKMPENYIDMAVIYQRLGWDKAAMAELEKARNISGP